jgi:phosphatidylglycerol:prolipoprotein diacylglycerol transferase
MIQYPHISPDIIRFGGFAIRWYSMMYLLGYIIGYQILKRRKQKKLFEVSDLGLENFISYLVVGMLLGARIFYVLFYNLDYYAQNPLEALMIWHGGLSFHGAAFGMTVSAWLFGRKYKVPFFQVTDSLVISAGPGLFLGRIGNFINAELYGRQTDLPWAMIFPTDEKQLPRHPSQLYQGFTEGLLLWFLLNFLQKYLLKKNLYKDGYLSAGFLMGYGVLRFLIEFTREPDAQLGYFFSWVTMGQLLCFFMVICGTFILWKIKNKKVVKISI